MYVLDDYVDGRRNALTLSRSAISELDTGMGGVSVRLFVHHNALINDVRSGSFQYRVAQALYIVPHSLTHSLLRLTS